MFLTRSTIAMLTVSSGAVVWLCVERPDQLLGLVIGFLFGTALLGGLLDWAIAEIEQTIQYLRQARRIP